MCGTTPEEDEEQGVIYCPECSIVLGQGLMTDKGDGNWEDPRAGRPVEGSELVDNTQLLTIEDVKNVKQHVGPAATALGLTKGVHDEVVRVMTLYVDRVRRLTERISNYGELAAAIILEVSRGTSLTEVVRVLKLDFKKVEMRIGKLRQRVRQLLGLPEPEPQPNPILSDRFEEMIDRACKHMTIPGHHTRRIALAMALVLTEEGKFTTSAVAAAVLRLLLTTPELMVISGNLGKYTIPKGSRAESIATDRILSVFSTTEKDFEKVCQVIDERKTQNLIEVASKAVAIYVKKKEEERNEEEK